MLEAVAAAVDPLAVSAGTTVIREGDPSDDLFIVRDGTFAASSETHGFLHHMTTDAWFGEIGLLHRRPRTATVVAETDANVWRIPGTAFLNAVERMELLPDPVRRGVMIRLAKTPDA